MKKLFATLSLVVLGSLCTISAGAQASHEGIERRLASLENKYQQHQSEYYLIRKEIKSSSLAIFLFAAFCALWAQNTGRNPWLWYFLGLFFNVITVFFVLHLNRQSKN